MTTPRLSLPALRGPVERRRILLAAVALALAVALGGVVARSPLLALGAAAAIAVGTAVVLRPAVAAYLLIGVTPLVAGIDRGRVLPMLRPNEALLMLCAAALLARALWTVRTGTRVRPRLGLIAGSLVLMAVFNSVVPLLWMAVRDVPISGDDLSYALVLWKFIGLYAVVRASVRSETEARRCLWVAMTAGSVVAVVAILQSLQLAGVTTLLDGLYAPFGDATMVTNSRGGATLGLAAATADLMIINLAVVAGFWARYGFRPWVLAPLAALFVAGTLAAGQFSSAIGLVVAVVAIGVVTRRAAVPLVLGLVAVAAAVPLAPVIANRLSGFDRASGLPESWVGRLDNLRTYFWPRLLAEHNYLLGVQPSARVPSPRTLALPWVWIESGYTWLLWGGGVGLLLGFGLFVVASIARSRRLARDPGVAGVLATAVFVAVTVLAVLMLFDPHLTYRGSADLLFTLLALMAAVDPISGPTSRPPAPPTIPGPAADARPPTRIEVDRR